MVPYMVTKKDIPYAVVICEVQYYNGCHIVHVECIVTSQPLPLFLAYASNDIKLALLDLLTVCGMHGCLDAKCYSQGGGHHYVRR